MWTEVGTLLNNACTIMGTKFRYHVYTLRAAMIM